MTDSLRSLGRAVVRVYAATGLRGVSRLRQLTDPLLAPSGGIELRPVGPCRVPLSHGHEATRNMAYGVYEPAEIAAVRTLVKPGDTVADVGANVGYFAAQFASMVGPEGKVHAFEPGPTPLGFLRRTAESNRYGNIEIHAIAVSDRGGEATFYETESIISQGYGRIDERPSAKFSEVTAVTVPVVSLEEFFAVRDTSRLSFVKLDVEGQERQSILGMRGLFERGLRPSILTEVTIEGRHLDDLKVYAEILQSHGYRIYRPGAMDRPVGIEELRPGLHGNVIWIAERNESLARRI